MQYLMWQHMVMEHTKEQLKLWGYNFDVVQTLIDSFEVCVKMGGDEEVNIK